MSLCCETKINAPLIYEEQDKDMMKTEIQPIRLWQNMVLSQKGNLARVLSMRSLQAESIFPMAHNEEKIKRNSLCFICSHVKMDVFMSKHER